MNNLVEILAREWTAVADMAPRLLLALLVMVLGYLVGRILGRFVQRLLVGSALSQLHAAFFRTLVVVLSLLVAGVVALNILGLDNLATSLVASGGVTAIVLGFAFREIGENLLAGFFLVFSRPFNVGDLIRSESFEGTVRSIQLRYTHIRTAEGSDVYLPSSQLFKEPLVNFTRDGLRRREFVVGIDYRDDAAAACSLIEKTCLGAEGVLATPDPGAYIDRLLPSYVELRGFYWINVFEDSQDMLQIRTSVLDSCRKALLRDGFTVSSETTTNLAIRETSAGRPEAS